MHHAEGVDRFEALRHAPQQAPQGVGRQRPTVRLDRFRQGDAGYVRGGEPRRFGGAVARQQRGGGLGRQAREVVHLLPEAAYEPLVLGDDGRQHLLDGRVPPLDDAEVHPPHAARPETAHQGDRADLPRVPFAQRLGAAAREVEPVLRACPVHRLPVHRSPRSPVSRPGPDISLNHRSSRVEDLSRKVFHFGGKWACGPASWRVGELAGV